MPPPSTHHGAVGKVSDLSYTNPATADYIPKVQDSFAKDTSPSESPLPSAQIVVTLGEELHGRPLSTATLQLIEVFMEETVPRMKAARLATKIQQRSESRKHERRASSAGSRLSFSKAFCLAVLMLAGAVNY